MVWGLGFRFGVWGEGLKVEISGFSETPNFACCLRAFLGGDRETLAGLYVQFRSYTALKGRGFKGGV